MDRIEFDAQVPPIERESIPLVPPEIVATKMADEPDNIPIVVASIELLRGMGKQGYEFHIQRCLMLVSHEMQPALKGYVGWAEMDFDEQVAFAVDAIRERLWEHLSGPDLFSLN